MPDSNVCTATPYNPTAFEHPWERMLPCARINVALASDCQQISGHTQEDRSERSSSCPPPRPLPGSGDEDKWRGWARSAGAVPCLLLSWAGIEKDGDTPCEPQLLWSVWMFARFSSRLHCSKQKQSESNFSGISKEANTRPMCRRKHTTQWLFLKPAPEPQLFSNDGAWDSGWERCLEKCPVATEQQSLQHTLPKHGEWGKI